MLLDLHCKFIKFFQRISANSDDVGTWVPISVEIRFKPECSKNNIAVRRRYARIKWTGIDFAMAQERLRQRIEKPPQQAASSETLLECEAPQDLRLDGEPE